MGEFEEYLCESEMFFLKSMYMYLMASRVDLSYKFLWDLKIPSKIKVFCWLIVENRVLIRENVRNRG